MNLTCLTGFVRRRPPVSIFQRGTHLLVDQGGNVIAVLTSDRVNLFGLEGRFVTVCGIDEGQIEGVTSLRVIQAFPLNIPGSVPPPAQVDLRLLLLLLLLSQPNLLNNVAPDLLRFLLLSTIFGTSAGTGVQAGI